MRFAQGARDWGWGRSRHSPEANQLSQFHFPSWQRSGGRGVLPTEARGAGAGPQYASLWLQGCGPGPEKVQRRQFSHTGLGSDPPASADVLPGLTPLGLLGRAMGDRCPPPPPQLITPPSASEAHFMQEGTPDPPARGSCEHPSQAQPTSLRCAGGDGARWALATPASDPAQKGAHPGQGWRLTRVFRG